MTPRPVLRAEVLMRARAWIGTPYHHQASRCAVGADCLGLVRGLWRDLYGCEPEAPPPYTRDWAEASGEETLLAAALRHLDPVDPACARDGDVLVFRIRPGAPAKHVGLRTSSSTFIHATEGAGVVETTLVPWWRRRIAAVFAFPGVTD